MGVESALYTRLSNWVDLTALVSDRIYPLILPQNCTLPAVTYQRIASQPRVTAMGVDPGMARPRFQITAWATDFDTSRAVIDACRLAVERWMEPVALIDDGYVVMEIDNYDPETLEYSSIIDVLIAHREEAPDNPSPQFQMLASSSGLEINMPAPTGSGTFYYATDTQKLYYDSPT